VQAGESAGAPPDAASTARQDESAPKRSAAGTAAAGAEASSARAASRRYSFESCHDAAYTASAGGAVASADVSCTR